MEFEFTRNTLMGEYYVKCSMGHEIVGRWLQEEIGKDKSKIDQVLALVERSRTNFSNELSMVGKEITLSINEDEVTIQENVLGHDYEMEEGSEFDFYNCESQASCGIDDFELLIERWVDFLGL
ncbi:YacL family protein [Vibrio sp. D404a]|uniref:YacL family protein n=1 Tax=unclassified Vibrio TaxID=2614977 RepID=UPI002556CD17|nr:MULTISPECIES: YacL family protein [unclassified Vibrio]MDK9737947.1 YacL family protein [Vibrio sp. D404a]MDK9798739.1 YacL family protein [Vibrio sp. D449a]